MLIGKKKQLIREKIIAEHGNGDSKDPKCVKLLRFIDLLEESNIPVGYWFLKMDEFSGPKNIKSVVLDYTGDLKSNYLNGKSICFVGNQGTGKTMSAVCILKKALKTGFSAHYITASDLMSDMVSDKKIQTRDMLKNADFLVIDEIDSRFFPSDPQKELFSGIYENIFRHRAHNLMPTILCTNETSSLLNVFYGQSKQSIESLHSQHLTTHIAAGKDYRRK